MGCAGKQKGLFFDGLIVLRKWFEHYFQSRTATSRRPSLKSLRAGILGLYTLTVLSAGFMIMWGNWRLPAGHGPDTPQSPGVLNLLTLTTIALALILLVTLLLTLLMQQIRRLEKLESRLHLTQFAVDQSPDMILWCDPAGRVRYANQLMIQSSGYSMHELLALKYSDLLTGNDCTQLHQQMIALHRRHGGDANSLRTRRQRVVESRFRCRDDTSFPVEITLSLIDYGEKIYLCLCARDITGRQEAERELHQHRDHLQELVTKRTAEIRTVLDASPLAIALSVQNQIRIVNPAFENLFGYATADIVGKPEGLILQSSPEHSDRQEQIDLRIKTSGAYRGEIELRRKDGTAFWAVLFAKALNKQAPERGMVLIVEDITAQRIAAEVIRRSERLRRSIISATPGGFAVIDSCRCFVDVNMSFCSLTGQDRDKLLGQPCESVLGPLAASLFPAHAAAGSKYSYEVSLPGRNGHSQPLLANGGIIPDEQGKSEYAFVFLADLSSQKEVERHLSEAKVAAEAASNAKNVFLAQMSHELRTPLHAILSFSEIGGSKVEKVASRQLARYFDCIHTSGKRLLALINDQLDMSRMEANKMAYDKRPHALKVTANNAVTEISPLLAAKKITVKISDSPLEQELVYDEACMTQVLVNLLDNAIKYSPYGGTIQIRLINKQKLADGTPVAGFCVRDNGPGIAPNDLERIFEVFTQGRGPTAGGTGLGLAISRQIVHDHGGSITASNHPDGGATFTIMLPAPAFASEPPQATLA